MKKKSKKKSNIPAHEIKYTPKEYRETIQNYKNKSAKENFRGLLENAFHHSGK